MSGVSQHPDWTTYLRSFPRSPSEHFRGALTLSAVMALSTAAMAQVTSQDTIRPQRQPEPPTLGMSPPVPPPLLLRDVVPSDALNINRRIPFSSDPINPARPFKMEGDRQAFDRAVECLATAVYFEAGAEPLDGQRAVAQVVLNRVRHPAFVRTVCGVVFQRSAGATGCQFSFVCDGSLRRPPTASGWVKARAIAAAALRGSVFAPVGYATHYHADYVVPYWATSLAKRGIVGRHIFYGWPQWWGRAAAFAKNPTGKEPDPRQLREGALALPAARQALTLDLAAQVAPSPGAEESMTVIQLLAGGSPLGDRAQQGEFDAFLLEGILQPTKGDEMPEPSSDDP